MKLLERYDAILKRVAEEVASLYGPRLVACAVFGSVGRGTPRHDSDIDLLIVARDLPRGRFARVEEFLPVESRLEMDLRPVDDAAAPIELSPVFKTPEESEEGSPLFLDMVEDAKILVDAEGILARRLDRLRGRLKDLGARRVWSGNAWYWELKPDLRPGEVFAL
ncbi:MAG: nucleotidyltransferase domain-containing protein [Acidobacteriia bacterium]|nr:nucleotidyltransferase domain-containing protein [Terriglobia bacterium]